MMAGTTIDRVEKSTKKMPNVSARKPVPLSQNPYAKEGWTSKYEQKLDSTQIRGK